MDAESLAQIQQIVTTAVTGAEHRLRDEIGSAVSGAEGRLRQEFGEKTDALASSLRHEFGEKFEEAKRHRGVLHEDALHRIDLVVEGHQALHQKIDNLEAKMEHEFLETRSFMQLSYRQLQDRVETLEQKVQLIEKRLGRTN
jgi:hypothetical protein